ncbi:hypothetical protein BIU82_16240 [Arthrobacter sp. SW1]|uniref:DUF3093 domain-containing protein n=1 Tax=Arthrobacter sp. SW1 TaxID=1920889 RepID=UPI000877B73E|nr:DUF3093 domain-containing protein [Arthrobacter sp. SW1]OFI39002.1 hypothetical protein BIU82_16240 [Arthrobacter sp. SW1]
MPEATASSPMPGQPLNGSDVLFSEKLWPSVWIWLIVAGLSGAGILVFAPISALAGIIAALVLAGIMTVLLLLSTPAIVVRRDSLQVGRASIPRALLGQAEAFRKDEATAERGTRLNGLAFLCIRGWIDPVVRIPVNDPEDRTPYWLTSTRRPDELLKALAAPTA